MPSNPSLSVVIPVYNESDKLNALLGDWKSVFKNTGVPYKIILIDDGSKDNSLSLLQKLAASDPTLDIHTQPNAGHGPAILNGYRRAIDGGAEFIFQIDSDHQLETSTFRELWANRDEYDLLLAERRDKNASQSRQWVSRFTRWSVRLLFGSGVGDINSPYRLMRSKALQPVLQKIPADSFAPNVLITAWFVKKRYRIFIATVNPMKDKGRKSRMNRYFLRGVLRSFRQLIAFRIK
jgi:glycosyltransferase involved in cell wall biosynthesis